MFINAAIESIISGGPFASELARVDRNNFEDVQNLVCATLTVYPEGARLFEFDDDWSDRVECLLPFLSASLSPYLAARGIAQSPYTLSISPYVSAFVRPPYHITISRGLVMAILHAVLIVGNIPHTLPPDWLTFKRYETKEVPTALPFGPLQFPTSSYASSLSQLALHCLAFVIMHEDAHVTKGHFAAITSWRAAGKLRLGEKLSLSQLGFTSESNFEFQQMPTEVQLVLHAFELEADHEAKTRTICGDVLRARSEDLVTDGLARFCCVPIVLAILSTAFGTWQPVVGDSHPPTLFRILAWRETNWWGMPEGEEYLYRLGHHFGELEILFEEAEMGLGKLMSHVHRLYPEVPIELHLDEIDSKELDAYRRRLTTALILAESISDDYGPELGIFRTSAYHRSKGFWPPSRAPFCFTYLAKLKMGFQMFD